MGGAPLLNSVSMPPDATAGPALARKIETTGWTTVLLGVVCIGLAAVQALLPKLLEVLAGSLDEFDDPSRVMREATLSGAREGALINLLFGLALLVIGLGVARRVRWAHPALAVASWASVAVLAALAKPSMAPFVAVAGEGSVARVGMLCVGVLLLVAQIAAVLWFLRFWRKPEVRGAFR
jgi:hypothetical protein